MSTQATVTPRTGSRFLRVWFPILILAIAPVIVAGFWLWPDADWARERRVTYTAITLFAGTAGLLAWMLVSSGWPWSRRLILLALLVGGALGSIRNVKFTGDMVPIVTFRWDATHDEVVEAHRQGQAAAPPAPEVKSSANRFDHYDFRGHRRDGVIEGPPLRRDWSKSPPRELWRQPVGGGYAGFAVSGNLLATIEQRRDEEVVVGYDATTGHQRWKYPYPAHFQETMGGPGPRATPTISDKYVYSLGAAGMLVCLEAATGAKKWQVNTLENNANISWAMSGSPLIVGDNVVVNPGSQTDAARGRALLAFDRETGKPVWAAGSHRAGYASPMLVSSLGGQPQIVIFDAAGLGGHDASTGAELWRHPWVTYQEINVAQPLVFPDDRIVISSGYGHGCAMLRVTQSQGRWSVEELWQNREMRCKFTSPVAFQGHLFGLDEGILVCLDEASGKRTWKEGRYGHGLLLLTDDLLVIFSEDGRLALVEAKPESYRELANLKVFDERKNWNHLALADGKVYLRNHREMTCYDLTR